MIPGLVSVVIPTYNYGHFLTETIESVLAQTYRNYEIIVVDDGSTDNTRDRLAPYMDRIRYVFQDNQGLSAARNTGIREARGELIALLDSDDLWHPRKLEIQADYLAAHPEVGMVASDHLSSTDYPQPAWPALSGLVGPRDGPACARDITLEHLVVRSHFGSCSVVARAECFRTAGLFDTELRSVEDRDMWIRIASCRFPIVKLELPLWWYRMHPGSMSTLAARMERHDRWVLDKAFTTIPSLRWRWLLKLRALSHAARSAAYMYDASGMHFRALTRVIQSLLLWPVPFHAQTCPTPFERLRMLAVIALRLARLRAPHVAPASRASLPLLRPEPAP
jgi:glycosyltransferase involved in cell wall biosynthesis